MIKRANSLPSLQLLSLNESLESKNANNKILNNNEFFLASHSINNNRNLSKTTAAASNAATITTSLNSSKTNNNSNNNQKTNANSINNARIINVEDDNRSKLNDNNLNDNNNANPFCWTIKNELMVDNADLVEFLLKKSTISSPQSPSIFLITNDTNIDGENANKKSIKKFFLIENETENKVESNEVEKMLNNQLGKTTNHLDSILSPRLLSRKQIKQEFPSNNFKSNISVDNSSTLSVNLPHKRQNHLEKPNKLNNISDITTKGFDYRKTNFNEDCSISTAKQEISSNSLDKAISKPSSAILNSEPLKRVIKITEIIEIDKNENDLNENENDSNVSNKLISSCSNLMLSMNQNFNPPNESLLRNNLKSTTFSTFKVNNRKDNENENNRNMNKSSNTTPLKVPSASTTTTTTTTSNYFCANEETSCFTLSTYPNRNVENSNQPTSNLNDCNTNINELVKLPIQIRKFDELNNELDKSVSTLTSVSTNNLNECTKNNTEIVLEIINLCENNDPNNINNDNLKSNILKQSSNGTRDSLFNKPKRITIKITGKTRSISLEANKMLVESEESNDINKLTNYSKIDNSSMKASSTPPFQIQQVSQKISIGNNSNGPLKTEQKNYMNLKNGKLIDPSTFESHGLIKKKLESFEPIRQNLNANNFINQSNIDNQITPENNRIYFELNNGINNSNRNDNNILNKSIASNKYFSSLWNNGDNVNKKDYMNRNQIMNELNRYVKNNNNTMKSNITNEGFNFNTFRSYLSPFSNINLQENNNPENSRSTSTPAPIYRTSINRNTANYATTRPILSNSIYNYNNNKSLGNTFNRSNNGNIVDLYNFNSINEYNTMPYLRHHQLKQEPKNYYQVPKISSTLPLNTSSSFINNQHLSLIKNADKILAASNNCVKSNNEKTKQKVSDAATLFASQTPEFRIKKNNTRTSNGLFKLRNFNKELDKEHNNEKEIVKSNQYDPSSNDPIWTPLSNTRHNTKNIINKQINNIDTIRSGLQNNNQAMFNNNNAYPSHYADVNSRTKQHSKITNKLTRQKSFDNEDNLDEHEDDNSSQINNSSFSCGLFNKLKSNNHHQQQNLTNKHSSPFAYSNINGNSNNAAILVAAAATAAAGTAIVCTSDEDKKKIGNKLGAIDIANQNSAHAITSSSPSIFSNNNETASCGSTNDNDSTANESSYTSSMLNQLKPAIVKVRKNNKNSGFGSNVNYSSTHIQNRNKFLNNIAPTTALALAKFKSNGFSSIPASTNIHTNSSQSSNLSNLNTSSISLLNNYGKPQRKISSYYNDYYSKFQYLTQNNLENSNSSSCNSNNNLGSIVSNNHELKRRNMNETKNQDENDDGDDDSNNEDDDEQEDDDQDENHDDIDDDDIDDDDDDDDDDVDDDDEDDDDDDDEDDDNDNYDDDDGDNKEEQEDNDEEDDESALKYSKQNTSADFIGDGDEIDEQKFRENFLPTFRLRTKETEKIAEENPIIIKSSMVKNDDTFAPIFSDSSKNKFSKSTSINQMAKLASTTENSAFNSPKTPKLSRRVVFADGF